MQSLKRGDFIITYGDDDLYYVQQVALLDVGRFRDLQVAEDHKAFLEQRDKK